MVSRRKRGIRLGQNWVSNLMDFVGASIPQSHLAFM